MFRPDKASFLHCALPTHPLISSIPLNMFPQAPGLPKTRSGKIMRRVLRKIAAKQEDELGDISTLADPSVVQQLLETRGK